MARTANLLLAVLGIMAAGACASRGRELFIREGCVNCHRFRELGSGGALDLSEVGSRRDAEWIGTQIGNPASHNPASRMPAYPLIRGLDLRNLVAFLRH